MAEAILFNAERSKEIEDNAITSGLVDASGNLILTKNNGDTINAGNVKGPQGDKAQYSIPYNGASSGYLRIATLDGLNSSNGAHYQAFLSGLGNFGAPKRATMLIHAAQRGTDTISLKAWAWDLTPGVALYTRALGAFLFEVWIQLPAYQTSGTLTELTSWRAVRNLDGFTTTEPSNLVSVPIQDSDYSPKAVVSDRSDSLSDTVVVKALLPATYRGGNTKVKIGGVLSTDTYSWLSKYDPSGSREVSLLRTASGFVIQGQCEHNSAPLTLNTTNWRTYGERGSGSWSSTPRAVKLPSGLIVIDAMLVGNIGATIADGSLIATLAPGFRPEFSMMFPVEQGDVARAIRINPNGQIIVYGGGWSSNNWLTLSGIAFWAPGVANWTPVGSDGSSWGANFQREPSWDSEWGAPGFWKDPYGFVWFRGLTKIAAATSVDNVPIVNLPASHRSAQAEHHRSVGNQGYAGLGSSSTVGLTWKPNSPATANSHISMVTAILKTPDADSGNVWQPYAPAILNGWNPVGGGNQVPNYLLREDGLRMMCGIISGGTVGASMVSLEFPEMWPTRSRMTLPVMTNNGRGRITLNTGWQDGDGVRGQVTGDSVSNAWVSFDSRVWVP